MEATTVEAPPMEAAAAVAAAVTAAFMGSFRSWTYQQSRG
jgi:hypothetical protein